MNRALTFLFTLGIPCVAGCRDAGAGTARAVTGTQYIVGVDVSGSRTPTQLAEAQRLIIGLIERMSFGDRLVMIEAYRAYSDSAVQWQDSVSAAVDPARPRSRERRALERFHAVAPAVASTFFDVERSRTIQTTDLLYTVGRAADYAKAAGGRKTIVLLLSDMLNSTPEVNMERISGVPSGRWIDVRKQENRLPDLSGVCIYVVGADVTSSRGAAVRAFWKRYFEASGANFEARRYRTMVSDPTEIRCS